MSKIAFLSGVTGQDGAYLASLLLHKGYEVHGLLRRSSVDNTSRLTGILKDIQLHYGDLADSNSLERILHNIGPDEVYNLGAMSHVKVSFDAPIYTADVTGSGSIRMLEAVRQRCPDARYYQASSSEMFGSSPPPQSELTPFHPRSPYGCAKVFSYYATINYREAYGLHASNGILFNHESPFRGETFVTRKISLAAAKCKLGLQTELRLGNLDARRDWGFAGDFVEAMWLILQQPKPGDYVIATGETHSVREFVDRAFSHLGLNYKEFVVSDPEFYRPSEVDALQGDASTARKVLRWKPKVSFEQLVKMMVEADLRMLTGSSPTVTNF